MFSPQWQGKERLNLFNPLSKITESFDLKDKDYTIQIPSSSIQSPYPSPRTKSLNYSISLKNKFLPVLKRNNQLNTNNKNDNSLLSQYVFGLSRESLPKRLVQNHFLNKSKSTSKISINYSKSPKITELSSQRNVTFRNQNQLLLTERKTVKSTIKYSSCSNSPQSNSLSLIKENNTRVRTYQPNINENWKKSIGLKVTKAKILPSLVNDIDFQIKTLEEQIGLLLDNINHFKYDLIHDSYCKKGFENMNYKAKSAHNKDLEELIGILLLLPQIFLNEFYPYLHKVKNIRIPNKSNFIAKTIVDESECFEYNWKLFIDLVDYFGKCFEFYLTLSKEVDDMIFSEKKYYHIINIIEKARYDISSLVTRNENAKIVYQTDVELIKKNDKESMRIEKQIQVKEEIKNKNYQYSPKKSVGNTKSDGKTPKKTEPKEDPFETFMPKNKKTLTEKIVYDFLFKKNAKKERINRIEKTLKIKDNIFNDNNNNQEEARETNIIPLDKQLSLVNSKIIQKMFQYYNEDVRRKIITEREKQADMQIRYSHPKSKIISIQL